MQPAVNEIDAGHAGVKNCAPDIVETLLGQSPQLFCMIEAGALDNVVDVLKIAGQHKSQVPARSRPSHVGRFQYRNRPAPLGYLACNGEARKPRPYHANVDVEIEIEARTVRPCNTRRLIPAGFHDFVSSIGSTMRICRSTRRRGGPMLDWVVPLSTSIA